MTDKIERRGFIGGVLGSVAGLLGWRPKAEAIRGLKVTVPLKAGAARLAASLKPWPIDATYLDGRVPPGSSFVFHENWNDIPRQLPDGWVGLGALPVQDPFATFSVSTAEVA